MPRPPRNEFRLLAIAAIAMLPALGLALYLCWTATAWSWHGRMFASTVLVAAAGGGLTRISLRLRQQWQTLGNIIEAVRLGDYSLRSPGDAERGAYGELVRELNSLVEAARQHRLQAVETQTLLETIIRDIDVAIFAFDADERLRLANAAALRLLRATWPDVAQCSAEQLGLQTLLRSSAPELREHAFPAHHGRWGIRIEHYRERGRPQRLLFVTDLQQWLRAEERNAWSRLIRVLSHEVNNSLAPIGSISDSLRNAAASAPMDAELRSDLVQGLQLIEERARALTGFVRRYAELARLPAPQRQPLDLRETVRQVLALSAQPEVELRLPPSPAAVYADPGQLQQLLINILKNAHEAMAGATDKVQVMLEVDAGSVRLQVADRGIGLGNPDNLFVPFYSTKPGGSGIGLVLCRQIAEAHDGDLQLRNRNDGPGCIAELRLPRDNGTI